MSSHTEANYNKFTNVGKGTLVGNWAEERAIREFTGVGRTVAREHIPKKHLDFENPIICNKQFDNTQDRIYGQKLYTQMASETSEMGTKTDPAASLAQFGKKTLNNEAAIMAQIDAEIKEKEYQEYLKTQERTFLTSTGVAHSQKSYTENTVGRKVMRTQDGVNVNLPDRDEQLIVEHGTWRRRQKQPDDELSSKVPKGDYSQQQPVTLWTANLDRKNYYQSASVGPNPFARTSGLTQTADQTKAVSGFYGNINFGQEAYQSDFRRSQGTDLNLRNPYVEKAVGINNLNDIANRIVAGCRDRSPGNGLRALRVSLRRVTINGMVDPVELKYGLRTFGVELSEDESQSLLKSFDPSRCGKISLNELMHCLRQGSWNAGREACATQQYNRIDKRANQSVTIEELESHYDFTPNPEYAFGQKSGTEMMNEFLSVWETQARDGIISLAEFLDFYKDVSPTVQADNVFANMVNNSWK